MYCTAVLYQGIGDNGRSCYGTPAWYCTIDDLYAVVLYRALYAYVCARVYPVLCSCISDLQPAEHAHRGQGAAVRPAFFGRVLARSGSVRSGSASGPGQFRNQAFRFGSVRPVRFGFLLLPATPTPPQIDNLDYITMY